MKCLSQGTNETSLRKLKLLDHLRSSPVPWLRWTTPRLQTDAPVRNGHPNRNQTLGVDGNASTLVQHLLWSGNRSFRSTYCIMSVIGTIAATTWSFREEVITTSGESSTRSRLQPHRLLLKRALAAAPLRFIECTACSPRCSEEPSRMHNPARTRLSTVASGSQKLLGRPVNPGRQTEGATSSWKPLLR